jgi:hypothetical protein
MISKRIKNKGILRIATLFSVRFFVSSLYCICALFLNLISFSTVLSFLATWLLQELAALRFFLYLIGFMLPFLDCINKINYVCRPTYHGCFLCCFRLQINHFMLYLHHSCGLSGSCSITLLSFYFPFRLIKISDKICMWKNIIR